MILKLYSFLVNFAPNKLEVFKTQWTIIIREKCLIIWGADLQTKPTTSVCVTCEHCMCWFSVMLLYIVQCQLWPLALSKTISLKATALESDL